MDKKIQEHLDAIDRWISEQEADVSRVEVLTSEERKQLSAVNKSIQQLTALGVSIPDELRQIKLTLSAKDVSSTRSAEHDQVKELIGELGRLISAAKAVLNDTKQKSKTYTHKRGRNSEVSLATLIEKGYFSIHDRMELCWKKSGPVYEGTCNPDGSVIVNTPSGPKSFETLSSAAMKLSNNSLNGWLCWWRINPDGSRTSMKEIRSRYLSEGGDKAE